MQRQKIGKISIMVSAMVLALVVGTGLRANADESRGPSGERLFVYANTVLGGGPHPSGPICAETNRYPVGQTVVWRIRVLDKAGRPMDDTDLESVIIRLPDNQEFKAKFGNHPSTPPPTDSFWSAAWHIPTTYPTGSLDYEVIATAHGDRVGTFQDFNVGPSLLTVVP